MPVGSGDRGRRLPRGSVEMMTWSVVLVLSLLARVELESLETLCGMFDGERRAEGVLVQMKYGMISGLADSVELRATRSMYHGE